MKSSTVIGAAIATVVLGFATTPAFAIDDIPDRSMVSKGGVLYPHTGDSREIFQTPPNARELFPPGTLVGVLPTDCISASSGEVASFYRCNHNFALKEEVLQDGRTVYRVIENP